MKLQKEKGKIRDKGRGKKLTRKEHFEFSRFKLDSLVKIQITKARRRGKKPIKSERLKRREKIGDRRKIRIEGESSSWKDENT